MKDLHGYFYRNVFSRWRILGDAIKISKFTTNIYKNICLFTISPRKYIFSLHLLTRICPTLYYFLFFYETNGKMNGN